MHPHLHQHPSLLTISSLSFQGWLALLLLPTPRPPHLFHSCNSRSCLPQPQCGSQATSASDRARLPPQSSSRPSERPPPPSPPQVYPGQLCHQHQHQHLNSSVTNKVNDRSLYIPGLYMETLRRWKMHQSALFRSQWTPERSTKTYRPVPFPMTPTSKAEPGKIENENFSPLSTRDVESGKLEWKTERRESGQVRW